MRPKPVSKVMSKASSFMSRRRWPASWIPYKCEEAISSRPATRFSLWTKQRRKRHSIWHGRRWSFPKLSSHDRKNFFDGSRCRAGLRSGAFHAHQDRQRVAQAEWNFNQKRQAAPQAGLVYDTLFRQGEWVAAGKTGGRAFCRRKTSK